MDHVPLREQEEELLPDGAVSDAPFAGQAVSSARLWRLRAVLLASPLVLGGAALLAAGHWRAPWVASTAGVVLAAAVDVCTSVQQDTEIHTRGGTLYHVDNVPNKENCCAECSANPDCGVWMFVEKAAGRSNRCYLKSLAVGEVPRNEKRIGVVSGMVPPNVKKHGVLAKKRAEKLDRRTPKEASISSSKTCPGPLHLKGVGNVSVVGARWRKPGHQASIIDVHGAVVPHLGARAYFASSCKPGSYNHKKYTPLHLLGGRLKYTADISKVGCGCNSQFHLVPMCSNKDKSRCGDFFCEPGVSPKCGAICAKIGVQNANQYAWSSSLHSHYDEVGHAAGYGGGSTDWTADEYGPGALCIDTTWPFQVEVSFPIDVFGNLASMVVTLTQEGHNCPLRLSLEGYKYMGKDAMLELTKVLKQGVTPVMSYDNSDDFRWLDGAGVDGSGPCVREVPESCPSKVRFYDFAFEEGAANHDDFSPLTDPLGTDAGFMPESGDESSALRPGEPCKDDCLTKGSLGGGHPSVKGGHLPAGTFEEKGSDDEEWQVLIDGLEIWSGVTELSNVLDVLGKGQIVSGKRSGDWVRLNHRHGFVIVKKGDQTCLKQRTVKYKKMAKGSCMEVGLFAIEDMDACITAARALGSIDSKVKVYNGPETRPRGCHVADGQLWLSTHGINNTVLGTAPICANIPILTTTVTVTGSTSTSTSTSGKAVKTTTTLKAARATSTTPSTTTTTTVTTSSLTTMKTTTATSTTVTTVTTKTTQTTTETWSTTIGGQQRLASLLRETARMGLTTNTSTSSSSTSHTRSPYDFPGNPSLFCIEAVREKSYELPLVKEQARVGASIFACDEYVVFCDARESLTIGTARDSQVIKTVVIPSMEETLKSVSKEFANTPGAMPPPPSKGSSSWRNTLTFMQVWKLVREDGRYMKHHWTVKVDPDAVFFPARLRMRMDRYTEDGVNSYIMNCNRVMPVAMFGALEIFSKVALHTFLTNQYTCRANLGWHTWGEDYFVSHCMDLLKVGRIYDFELLSDKHCMFRPCWDKTRVAYHGYKDADPQGSWFRCWNSSGGEVSPGGL